MYNFIYDLVQKLLGRGSLFHTENIQIISAVSYILFFTASLILCIVVRIILRTIIIKIVKRFIEKSFWLKCFYTNKTFHHISNIAIPITLSALYEGFPDNGLIGKIIGLCFILVFLFLVSSLTSSVSDIYNHYDISKTRPIKGLLQVTQGVLYVIAGILAIAVLLGENPFALIGGIGAMTAVTSIIFKDSIMGFVSGILLVKNDMIRIGDWIEVPQHSANGTVIELTMITVKVENFDKTITTVPAHLLISDSFVNWRGMTDSGGRRIKRELYIDVLSIKLCDDELINKFKEMKVRNAGLAWGETNLGLFRAYVLEYLKAHPGINNEMSVMVRQNPAGEHGVPLEVYCFTNTTVWAEYEEIQSEIFEHLFSIVKEFELKIYQKPSGHDIGGLYSQKKI